MSTNRRWSKFEGAAPDAAVRDAFAMTDRPNVLVVEDEPLVLFSIADDLREAGFTVYEAPNADVAIAILNTVPDIALVFTDIDMPGSMDGLRLSALVRDRWPPVRIVVTSGHPPRNLGVLPEGGIFVPKPYLASKVVETLRQLLR